MPDTLLDAVLRHTEAHADATGIARAAIPGLMTVRATAANTLAYSIYRPLVCLVLQGSKQVTMGTHVRTVRQGDSLLVTADVPTISQILHASARKPYLALVLDLDPAVIAELGMQIVNAKDETGPALQTKPTDDEVAGVALRLMNLLQRPDAIPVLQAPLVREMHYWLLTGRHGAAIRRLGWPDSHAHRIGRAIAVLQADFARPLPIERLASVAKMSASSFHQHFRSMTSLSPLQFQKQLRLIEARRRMSAEGMTASSAAFAVGYESVPQFTREYRRMFGRPPAQDRDAVRAEAR